MSAGRPDKRTYNGATDKREEFDEDGSGGRRQTYTDARQRKTTAMGTRRIRDQQKRRRMQAEKYQNKQKDGVTPQSYIRYLSSFTSQPSSFGGRGSGGNGFCVGSRGGGEGGGSSDILQSMQMDQSPLYASRGFGVGVVISGNGGLGGGGRISLWRLGGWWRGWQQRGTSSYSYRPRSAVKCFCMPAQTEGMAYYVIGGGILYQWRRRRGKREVNANFQEVSRIQDKL